MLRSILFGILGFIAGFMVFAVGFGLTEFFAATVHPFPPGLKMEDAEAVNAYIKTYPDWVLGVAAVAWGITVFLAAGLAARIGGRIAGFLIFLSLGIMFACNLLFHSYPLWFKVAEFASIPLLMLIGLWVVPSPKVTPAVPVKSE